MKKFSIQILYYDINDIDYILNAEFCLASTVIIVIQYITAIQFQHCTIIAYLNKCIFD